ncbi:MAG: hypothetical protein H6752_17005 [Candidatus Omnitrophica bacterium]|nr:hypothetical protein [Candidatus Omnitrophota bacterium]
MRFHNHGEWLAGALLALSIILVMPLNGMAEGKEETSSHPWRPPFGLDRVGQLSSNHPASTTLEADAEARPDEIINPVDLGTILVPDDWLLLGPGQSGTIEVAAISHDRDIPNASVIAWFESKPNSKSHASISLKKNELVGIQCPLPEIEGISEEDFLTVAIMNGEEELWRKEIRVLLVPDPPTLPVFGATELKLRYDAPISILNRDGSLDEMDYDKGWDPSLSDVVVSLPNGSRFVFWRGASYIPFWAGRYNTGLCYEWAETTPPPDGFVDSIEPLMDKELRYSRVEILENGPGRVHVRWSYQSCDFNYKVWGDFAVEDYVFYPDGFGTRTLTLTSEPDREYELSEFILLTPANAYPIEVLPSNLIEILFLDGEKRSFDFPFQAERDKELLATRNQPAIFRVRLNKQERLSGIYFNPRDFDLPQIVFGPFFDQGVMVTPAYWGSHWPLARGKTTGGSIDDRIHLTPSHNSLMTWGFKHRPEPIEDRLAETKDALGKLRTMQIRKWRWLIGMTDLSDDQLIEKVKSLIGTERFPE